MVGDRIAVLDFGGQYCHLIAKRIRRLGVFSEILPPDAPTENYDRVKGIILSGSPASIVTEDVPFNRQIYSLDIPILGICYGHQMLARDLGGTVGKQDVKEFATVEMEIMGNSPIFKGIPSLTQVLMTHHDKVVTLPPSFEVIGRTQNCDTAAIADHARNFYGFQFHPEVTHTEHGMSMLDNFVGLCGCERTWNMKEYYDSISPSLLEKVGDRNVFFLISGGVDSTVAYAMLNRILGTGRVYGLHIDTGLMRKGESHWIHDTMEKYGFNNFRVYDASEEFFTALQGVSNPEEKRRIIGNTFLSVQRNVLEEMGLNPSEWVLGQGTIYPDRIESGGTKNAEKIKTHHNRVPLVQEMIRQGLIIEPLMDLYKDEVRALGQILGLPSELVDRHPFPGPGIAVRCLCYEGRTGSKELADLDREVNEYLQGTGYSGTLLPIKSVGVQGDKRTYAHPIALQGPLDWDALERISTSLTNRFPEINRCVYVVSDHDKKDIEHAVMHTAYLTRERVAIAQEADNVAMNMIAQEGLMKDIWQMPTVLIPLALNGSETVILRPVSSIEAMTASWYRMPEQILRQIAGQLVGLDGIGAVFIDITNKPPATIEWE